MHWFPKTMTPHRRLPRFGADLRHEPTPDPKGFVPSELRRATLLSGFLTLLGWPMALAVPLIINPLFFVFGGLLGLYATVGLLRCEPVSWGWLGSAALFFFACLAAIIGYLSGALELA